jgi:hypothetical protein
MILWRYLNSPANWCGLLLAIAVVAARAYGLLGAGWGFAALIAYGAGFWIGKTFFGTPQLIVTDLAALDLALTKRDAPAAITETLDAIRDVARRDSASHFNIVQQGQVIALADAIEALHKEWLKSGQHLSVEDAFVAKRLALDYLPDTMRRYLAIPPKFAATKIVAQNKTPAQLFDDSIREMQHKVEQLQNDLSAKDAEAFVDHAQFLNQKFGAASVSPTANITKNLN